MFDLIKKSLLISLGAAIVTKEKVDEATRHLVDKGKINKEEADSLARDLLKSGEKQWEELQSQIRQSVAKVLKDLDIPKNAELEELKMRLEALEKRFAVVEAAYEASSQQGRE